MCAVRQWKTLSCDSGTTAVEFALIAAPLVMLVVGTLYAGLVMYSVAGLHSAVEAGARCYSVNTSQCGTISATESYAQNSYEGVGTPIFTASSAACGHEVSGTLSLTLNAGVASWDVPLSATACFP